jgi:hypothetical protein
MMRKFLIVALVLGISSAANAVLIYVDGSDPGSSIEIGEGVTPVISVVSEDASSWLGYIIIEEGGTGALSNPARLDAAGDMGAVSPYTEAGWGAGYELTIAMSPGGASAIAVGPQFTLDYVGGVLGQTATISLFVDPEYGTPVDSVAITVVPEPMTVILLGLGGLLLRRRK